MDAIELIRLEIAELDKRHEFLQNEFQQWIMQANKTQGHIQENRQQRDRLESLLVEALKEHEVKGEVILDGTRAKEPEALN